LGLTYLFMSQDIRLARHISDRLAVIYLGRIVELAPASELFAAPNHPYTQALLAESSLPDPKKRAFIPVKGEIPPPLARPSGCEFHPRCPYAMSRCEQAPPDLAEIAPGRWSACYLNDARA
jgi:peptide/nickel transport system ATP-binding protein